MRCLPAILRLINDDRNNRLVALLSSRLHHRTTMSGRKDSFGVGAGAGVGAAGPAPDIAIQGDNLTLHPPLNTPSDEQELLEPYARFRTRPLDALQELGQHLSGSEWRSYERPVGQEIFYPGYSDKIKSKVMRQHKLRRKIADLAQKRLEVEIHEGRLGPLGAEGETAEFRAKRDARRAQMEAQVTTVAEECVEQMITKLVCRRKSFLCRCA